MMVHTCDPSTQEVGTGGPGLPIWDWGQYACLCMHDHLTSGAQYTGTKLCTVAWHLPITPVTGGWKQEDPWSLLACWPANLTASSGFREGACLQKLDEKGNSKMA